jgi:hypothetical protein
MNQRAKRPFDFLPAAVRDVFAAYHWRKWRLTVVSRTLGVAAAYLLLVLIATHLDRFAGF